MQIVDDNGNNTFCFPMIIFSVRAKIYSKKVVILLGGMLYQKYF